METGFKKRNSDDGYRRVGTSESYIAKDRKSNGIRMDIWKTGTILQSG